MAEKLSLEEISKLVDKVDKWEIHEWGWGYGANVEGIDIHIGLLRGNLFFNRIPMVKVSTGVSVLDLINLPELSNYKLLWYKEGKEVLEIYERVKAKYETQQKASEDDYFENIKEIIRGK